MLPYKLTIKNKHPLQNDFFQVLKQVLVPTNVEAEVPPSSLSEVLLRDTLLHVLGVEPGFLPMLLQNICSFIQEVYDQGYSVELITCMLLCRFPPQTFTISLLHKLLVSN